MSAQDPFYYIKDQVDDSMAKLISMHAKWQQMSPGFPDRDKMTKVVLEECWSISRLVEELNRSISVAERNPAKFRVSPAEIEQRRHWTNSTKSKVAPILAAAEAAQPKYQTPAQRRPTDQKALPPEQNRDVAQQNDDYIAAESDRQSLLMREQNEDLEELSTSIERIGGVGITINEELTQQERLIDDLGHEVESTSNKLGYVQKKLEHVIRKAGSTGQLAMVVVLVILLIVLVMLVFYF